MDTTDPDESARVADIVDISKFNQTSVRGYLLRGSTLRKLRRFSVVKSRNVWLAESPSTERQWEGIISVLPLNTVVMRLGPISVIVRKDSQKKSPSNK